jgi:hypothetical protein
MTVPHTGHDGGSSVPAGSIADGSDGGPVSRAATREAAPEPVAHRLVEGVWVTDWTGGTIGLGETRRSGDGTIRDRRSVQ